MAAYRAPRGNWFVVDEIAAGFDFYSALLDLPEHQPPLSTRDYMEIQKKRSI